VTAWSLKGKVCLVTGATGGIGLAAARGVAREGATVVLVGRDSRKGVAAAAAISEETGNPAVECLQADLSSQAEVRRLAHDFRERHDRLHVLVNNVGVARSRRVETVDGIEMTFALNQLTPFLLTHLLLDLLEASAPARIINVSSGLHARARLDLGDLQRARHYRGNPAYAQSKLANVMFTYELARRLRGTGVTVNAMNPGLVSTRFGMDSGAGMRLAKTFANARGGKSAEAGADTIVWLASSPDVEGVSGRYFEKRREVRSSDGSYEKAPAIRLWKACADLTGVQRSRGAGRRTTEE
jgi:retinol dehydrogenase 14